MIPEELRMAPEAVVNHLQEGLRQVQENLQGEGLEEETIEEARYLINNPVTDNKIVKAYNWWNRNQRFLEEPVDSPANVAANLWGGNHGRIWFMDLYECYRVKP